MNSVSWRLLAIACVTSGCVTTSGSRAVRTWELYVREIPVAEVQVEGNSQGNVVNVSVSGDTASVTLRHRGTATLRPFSDAQVPGLRLVFYDEDWRTNRELPRLRAEQLVPLLERGRYDDVQKALDHAPQGASGPSRELMEVAPALMAKALESEPGRRLLDRLYHELISDNELLAAQKVLVLKAQRIAPERWVHAALDPNTKVFPIRKMGFTVPESAPIGAWRRADGGIDVWYPSRVPRDFPDAQGLPLSGGEIRLGEDEVVCVKLYDLGGTLRCGPALILLQYAHEVNAKLVWDWANLAMLVVPLGTGALAGKGAGAAGALAWFDRAAITLGVVFAVLDEHRGWLIEKFGARGKAFLRYADIVQSAVALYGLARIATAVPSLFSALGTEHQRLQQAIRSSGETLSAEEIQGLQDIDGEMQKLLREVEQLRNEGGAEIILIESARRLREKPPAAEPMPAIQEEPLRATGTDGRLVPISEEWGETGAVASTGEGGPKKPLTAAPPASQSVRAGSGGRSPWRAAPLSTGEAEVASALMSRGIPELQAQAIARRATELRVLEQIGELARNSRYRNPEGLRDFLDRWNRQNEGKIQALEDAVSRVRKGHEVALEGEGADVVDYTTHEAIQHKRIFGESRDIGERMSDAAAQLRGERGEVPPEGFTKIIDIGFDSHSDSPLRQADRNGLRKAFPSDREEIKGVDRIRITNDRGAFEFEPPFPIH